MFTMQVVLSVEKEVVGVVRKDYIIIQHLIHFIVLIVLGLGMP
jgi:hypothetical protein